MTPAMLANSSIGGGNVIMHQMGRNFKKEEASIYSRLLSIVNDAHYVESFVTYDHSPTLHISACETR